MGEFVEKPLVAIVTSEPRKPLLTACLHSSWYLICCDPGGQLLVPFATAKYLPENSENVKDIRAGCVWRVGLVGMVHGECGCWG